MAPLKLRKTRRCQVYAIHSTLCGHLWLHIFCRRLPCAGRHVFGVGMFVCLVSWGMFVFLPRISLSGCTGHYEDLGLLRDLIQVALPDMRLKFLMAQSMQVRHQLHAGTFE